LIDTLSVTRRVPHAGQTPVGLMTFYIAEVTAINAIHRPSSVPDISQLKSRQTVSFSTSLEKIMHQEKYFIGPR
jgi:hypothetical protein